MALKFLTNKHGGLNNVHWKWSGVNLLMDIDRCQDDTYICWKLCIQIHIWGCISPKKWIYISIHIIKGPWWECLSYVGLLLFFMLHILAELIEKYLYWQVHSTGQISHVAYEFNFFKKVILTFCNNYLKLIIILCISMLNFHIAFSLCNCWHGKWLFTDMTVYSNFPHFACTWHLRKNIVQTLGEAGPY